MADFVHIIQDNFTDTGPLFNKWMDALPQDLAKLWSRKIEV